METLDLSKDQVLLSIRKDGNVSYIEDAPMGTDPSLIEKLYSLGFGQQQQNVRTAMQQKGAKERTAMAQEGATQRTAMTNATSRENNKRSTGAQLSIAKQKLQQEAKQELQRLSVAEKRAKLNALSKLIKRTDAEEAQFQTLLNDSVVNPRPIPTINTPPPKPTGSIPSKQKQSVLGAKTQGMSPEFFRALQKG